MAKSRFIAATLLLATIGCSNQNATVAAPAASSVDRGAYLVTILGCGGCHTEGALLGKPSGQWLAGSRTGVAYTADEHDQNPGVVFPKNLTPDIKTGLGKWTEREIMRAISQGQGHREQPLNAVMPWMNYVLLSDADRRDIARYLKSLAPVYNPIPPSIVPGQPVRESYLRIGIYVFYPNQGT
ncbi:MAG: c-type cytochrome [Pseudomonadales bacterium]